MHSFVVLMSMTGLLRTFYLSSLACRCYVGTSRDNVRFLLSFSRNRYRIPWKTWALFYMRNGNKLLLFH